MAKAKFNWNTFPKPFFVMAPMDGITSSPFRRVCRKLGADVVFSEMIAAEAVYYKSKKTLGMMKFHDAERPIIIQIFGNDTEKMAVAAEYIEKEVQPDGIDINMGCPAKKVVSGGRGSVLLKDPKKALEIAKSVREATKLPLSVKMRTGWEKFDTQKLVVGFEKAGIDVISVHGRTKTQGFIGKVDLDAIKEIKKLVKIPVIGNGGIMNAQDAKRMLRETNCDGVMIARGALGNPWIFRSAQMICHSGNVQNLDYKPDLNEIIETALWHLKISIEEFGPKKGIFVMRKHYGWYFKGFDGASELRKKLVQADTAEEVEKLLQT